MKYHKAREPNVETNPTDFMNRSAGARGRRDGQKELERVLHVIEAFLEVHGQNARA